MVVGGGDKGKAFSSGNGDGWYQKMMVVVGGKRREKKKVDVVGLN